jgi:hypothetical protein
MGLSLPCTFHFFDAVTLACLRLSEWYYNVELKGREKANGYRQGFGEGGRGEREGWGERGRGEGEGEGIREGELGLCTKKCDGPQAVNYRWPVFDSEPSKGVRVKPLPSFSTHW